MKIKNGLIFSFFLILSLLLATNDVDTIKYRSTKTSKVNKESVISESVVYLSGENLRIDYLSPSKQSFVLKNDKVYFISEDDNGKKYSEKYKYSEIPVIMQQILKPSIFAASEFFQSISKGYKIKKQSKKQPEGSLYYAQPEKPQNISRIEYVMDEPTQKLYSYKIFNKEGGLISEVYFENYKTFSDKFILPTKIKTIIYGPEGVVEDMEEFSRIKVNDKIAGYLFEV